MELRRDVARINRSALADACRENLLRNRYMEQYMEEVEEEEEEEGGGSIQPLMDYP